MRWLSAHTVVIALLLIGCVDPNFGKKTEADDADKNNPNGKVDPAANANGRAVPNALEAELDKLVAADNKKRGKRGKEPVFRNNRVSGKRGLVGTTSDRVYDYNQVMRLKPKLRVVAKPKGQTVYSSAYFSATARASQLAFTRNMQIAKELNGGKWPSYDYYVDPKNRLRMHLGRLPPFAVYAYNDKNGKVVILEDPAARKKHEEASK